MPQVRWHSFQFLCEELAEEMEELHAILGEPPCQSALLRHSLAVCVLHARRLAQQHVQLKVSARAASLCLTLWLHCRRAAGKAAPALQAVPAAGVASARLQRVCRQRGEQPQPALESGVP